MGWRLLQGAWTPRNGPIWEVVRSFVHSFAFPEPIVAWGACPEDVKQNGGEVGGHRPVPMLLKLLESVGSSDSSISMH